MADARPSDLAGTMGTAALRSKQEQYEVMESYAERPDAPALQDIAGRLKRRSDRLSTGLAAVAPQKQGLHSAPAPQRNGPKPASDRKKRSK
jgi:hypothetical protein